jgi:hypothetical protein
MEEKDFKRIEQMLEQRDDKLRERISADMDRKVGLLRQEINGDFKHHLGVFTEDMHKNLQLVAEGHQLLSEKLDRVKIDLETKIETVAADLAAHRADTEGHKRGYMVREE